MRKIICILFAASSCFLSQAQLPQLNMVQVAAGFTAPVDIKNCGDDRIFIVERAGQIKIMNKNGAIRPTPFLDIRTRVLSSGGEQGLLTLAFGPKFKEDGYFYVNYITGSGSGTTRISRFQISDVDSNAADPTSEKILLTITQPYTNHNGATLMFGGDGYLYDTQGDGGSGGDPQNYAQNKNSLLGKILRIDVSDPDTTYTIPSGNPFLGIANTRPEIWSYGLRNPWRCSFDRITKDIWIGDVGQGTYEEIDFRPQPSTGGENYGWRCYEGFNTYNTSGCSGSVYTYPKFVYPHSYGGCSVTGGFVYRGTQFNKLWGRYLFTDYCSGKFWSLRQTSPDTFDPDTLQTFLTNQYSSFGEDNMGELYVSGVSNGRIYRVTETSDCNPVAFISFEDTISDCKPVSLKALIGDSLSYQWYDSNGPINEADSNVYNVQESGWYKVKVSKPLSGCESFSDSIYVEAYDSAVLTILSPLIRLCPDDSILSLADNIEPIGGVFSGNGVRVDTFYNSTDLLGNNTVVYHFNNNEGCPSAGSFIVEVNDTVSLQLAVNPSPLCQNADTFNLNSLVIPGGGIFSGAGVVDSTKFVPALADSGIVQLRYTYISPAGCSSRLNADLKVLAVQTLTKHVPREVYCNLDPDFSLDGFILPNGGSFSGTAVINDTFSPSRAGEGEFIIQYTFTDDSGCLVSDTFSIRVETCTAVDALTSVLGVKLYPNPNNGSFELGFPYEGDVELTITDMTGRFVFQRKNWTSGTAIDIKECSPGSYLMKVNTGHQTFFARVLKE